MNKTNVSVLWVAAFLIIPAVVCYSSGPPYREALPGYLFEFPRDHGAHPDFQTEWWYYTGHLFTEQKREFGFELTFFRFGNADPEPFKNPSRWAVRDIYLAHFAVSDIREEEFFRADKISREALGKAGAMRDKLSVWIDRWRAEVSDGVHRLQASDGERSVDLRLRPQKPPVIHGRRGISLKGGNPGEASHYYSLTRMKIEGSLRIGKHTYPVTGSAWMDHEFSTRSMPENLVGWDWFSLQLENGWEVMLYKLRLKEGKTSPFSSGTLIDPEGNATPLRAADFSVENLDYWTSPESGGRYPIRWTVTVPVKNIRLNVVPAFEQQELLTPDSTRVTYWEGAVRAEGKWEGENVSGIGYTEMTGYSEPLTGDD